MSYVALLQLDGGNVWNSYPDGFFPIAYLDFHDVAGIGRGVGYPAKILRYGAERLGGMIHGSKILRS